MFTQGGEFVKSFGSFGDGPGSSNSPMSIALDNSGRVYISEFRGHRIQIYDIDFTDQGDLIYRSLQRPHELVIDANGDLYVADTGHDMI